MKFLFAFFLTLPFYANAIDEDVVNQRPRLRRPQIHTGFAQVPDQNGIPRRVDYVYGEGYLGYICADNEGREEDAIIPRENVLSVLREMGLL